MPRQPTSPPLPTLSSLLVSTPQALALLDVSKELTFVRRTQLPLLGLIENMSGYVCPHCSDIVGIFGQGGAEDFCRREEERKDSKVEGEGGGCRFLGRIPIDRELVKLLDDAKEQQAAAVVEETAMDQDGASGSPAAPTLVKVVSPEEAERLIAAQQNQMEEAVANTAAADEAEVAAAMVSMKHAEGDALQPPPVIRTLVARYAGIPSAPVVAKIAAEVKALIEEQERREKEARGF